jgi:predicted metal-dependent phosphotriesterase family hydrolase
MATVTKKTTTVETACGPVPVEELGATLLDERIFDRPRGSDYWRPQIDLEAVRAALRSLRKTGVDTLVDTTSIEAGRDPEVLAELSRDAELNIVLCTGLDSESDGVGRAFSSLSTTELASLYVDELASGLPGSTVRTGALLVNAGPTPTEVDARAALAAAIAHAETAAPVLARAPGSQILALVDSMTAHGVDPERVVACALDDELVTWGCLDELARRGVRLGFTQAGALDPLARAAAIAYVLHRYGAGRVSLGSGGSAWRSARSEGERGYADIASLRDSLGTFGVAAATVTEALETSGRALFAPLREAPDGD